MDDGDWCKPREVLRRYALTNGGRVTLASSLGEYLRDGSLRSRGVFLGEVEANSIDFAWRQVRGKDSEARPDLIAPSFWRSSKLWSSDKDAGHYYIRSLDPARHIPLVPVRRAPVVQLQFD